MRGLGARYRLRGGVEGISLEGGHQATSSFRGSCGVLWLRAALTVHADFGQLCNVCASVEFSLPLLVAARDKESKTTHIRCQRRCTHTPT